MQKFDFGGRTRHSIVGTAQSWCKCPWDDPGLIIHGINDAWTLGFPRADVWWDLHPLDHFYFRKRDQRAVYAEDVPHGYYVRPEGHLEWLKEQAKTIPVFLQQDPPKDWPINAQRFPIEDIEVKYGSYWASGPAYEVAWAIEQGATEIQIWGIHLATEHEYREQRPQFEHMLGIARGRGIKIVMADASPLLKHGWKYAYEPKPTPHPALQALPRIQHEKHQVIKALARWPRFTSKDSALDRLRRLEAVENDCHRALSLVQQQGQPIVAPVLGEPHG